MGGERCRSSAILGCFRSAWICFRTHWCVYHTDAVVYPWMSLESATPMKQTHPEVVLQVYVRQNETQPILQRRTCSTASEKRTWTPYGGTLIAGGPFMSRTLWATRPSSSQPRRETPRSSRWARGFGFGLISLVGWLVGLFCPEEVQGCCCRSVFLVAGMVFRRNLHLSRNCTAFFHRGSGTGHETTCLVNTLGMY